MSLPPDLRDGIKVIDLHVFPAIGLFGTSIEWQ
jgi:hypothetical protein